MQKSNKLIARESRSLSQLFAALSLATLSGYVTYFAHSNVIWVQWTYLLHMFAGILMTLPLLVYIVRHFVRTLGLKRPLMTLSGMVFTAITLYSVVGGYHLGIAGQSEAKRWVYDSHIIATSLVLAMLVIHLLLHRFTLTDKRRKAENSYFTTIVPGTLKGSLYGTAAGTVSVVVATLIYQQLPSPYLDEAAVTPYQLTYGDHPFRPSQTESFNQGFMDVRRLLHSERCGTCHAAITEEWKSSLHAQAASDQTYQSNVRLLAKKKGMAATRYCEGCHAPVALLSGELTEGGRLDTQGHMIEGVGCLGCHGIGEIVHLKGVASYLSDPRNDYLFAGYDAPLAITLHNYLIRIQPRSHRSDMNRPPIFQPEICSTCHTQYMDKDMNDWGWIKMQDEYSAWLNSPYSGQSKHEFAQSGMTRCQDCHFPLISLADPSANAEGLTRSHRSLGANTAIPYYTGDRTHMEMTQTFLQSNKIRLHIEEPNRHEATYGERYVDPDTTQIAENPAYYYLNEDAVVNVVVSNTGVGHDFPGGTTDVNEAWLHFKVVDGQNKVIYESGAVGKDNNVDEKAQFYFSIPINRDGRHVWKHDLFNTVGDSYKRVIKAGSADIASYRFNVPSWAKSPINVSATMRYRKLNNKYARWALKDETIELPIVDMARDAISIPVRMKREIETGIPSGGNATAVKAVDIENRGVSDTNSTKQTPG